MTEVYVDVFVLSEDGKASLCRKFDGRNSTKEAIAFLEGLQKKKVNIE